MGRLIKRYQSTIYGPYRVAGLRSGALTALLMAACVAASRLMGNLLATPESWLTDGALAVGAVLFMAMYRSSLPDGKVTWKELMLFGLWLVLTAAAAYGLLLWLYCGAIDPTQADLFVQNRIAAMPTADEGGAEAAEAIERVRRYGAADWGFIAFFRSAVMGGLIAFLAAVLLRTEKGRVITKNQK